MDKGTYNAGGETDEEKIVAFLSKQNKGLTLAIIGALCALPENHGKNIRLERLAWYASKYCPEDGVELDRDGFINLIDTYFSSSFYEGPPESFFTADVAFFDGSMTVFPGVESFSYETLGRLILMLYTPSIKWPTALLEELAGVIQFLLRVSQAIATLAGYQRYLVGKAEVSPIVFSEQINAICEVCYISKGLVNEHKEIGIREDILQKLTIAPEELDQELANPDYNPLIYKPLVAVGEDYVLAVPTTLLTALNSLIFNQAKLHGVYDRLVGMYSDYNWSQLLQAFNRNGWQMTSVTLPPHESLLEAILKFDSDKHVYVLFIPDKVEFSSEIIENRITEIYSFHTENQAHLRLDLIVVVIGASGEQYSLMLPDMPGDMKFVQFVNYDLEKILLDPDTNQLTLWKYAKAINRAKASFLLHSLSGLDSFALFKRNGGSFFHSDEATPDGMFITAGEGFTYIAEQTQVRDRHSVPRQTYVGTGYIPVRRWASYGQIYAPIERSRNSLLVLESFDSSIWVFNDQAFNPESRQTADYFGEAILYWLLQFENQISLFFSSFDSMPLEIKVVFDTKILKNAISQHEYEAVNVNETIVNWHLDDHYTITLLVPWQFIKSIEVAGNLAERQLMKGVLAGLNELYQQKMHQAYFTAEALENLISTRMGNPLQRMILPRSVHTNPKEDPRWLTISERDLSEAETNYLLESLPSYLEPGRVIPVEIKQLDDKNKLCHELVTALIQKLDTKLQQFTSEGLITQLMGINEAITHSREYRQTQIPARIACFSNYTSEVAKLRKSENNLSTAGMVVRSLIEFVGSVTYSGPKQINDDDLDELLVIVDQIINWGTLSDILMMGFDDTWIGLLPSGRIGTDKAFYNDYLSTYQQAYTAEQVGTYMEDYAAVNDPSKLQKEGENSLSEEINDAFAAQFGVTLRNHLALHWAMAQIAGQHETSVLRIKEQDLFNQVSRIIREYTEDMFHTSLHLLTLKPRTRLAASPSGYKMYDVFPWRLNRELSFLRRPIYKTIKNGETFYVYGYRHMWTAAENLMSIIHSGRFNDPKYTKLHEVLGHINRVKGKNYRNEVCQWLSQYTSWVVIPHEVKLPPESIYGDVDVLAWDPKTRTIYSIECKNTVPARNIYEMKGELDNYLGKDGGIGMIHKHVRRNEWLHENPDQLFNWFKITVPTDFTIKSIVLTSYEIPAGYIMKTKPPLPILSFRILRSKVLSAESFDF